MSMCPGGSALSFVYRIIQFNISGDVVNVRARPKNSSRQSVSSIIDRARLIKAKPASDINRALLIRTTPWISRHRLGIQSRPPTSFCSRGTMSHRRSREPTIRHLPFRLASTRFRDPDPFHYCYFTLHYSITAPTTAYRPTDLNLLASSAIE